MDPSQALARTAKATNVSVATVKRICSKLNKKNDTVENAENPTFTSPVKQRSCTVTNFDDFNKCLLRRTILQFYERKEFPTLYKIKEELREKISFEGSLESLRQVVIKIGFKFGKINGRRYLMERSDVLSARSTFLQQMRRLRESSPCVVYLDETWVNQNHTVSKCWIDNRANQATGVKAPTEQEKAVD